jgi:hypothetical protein
VATRAGDIKAAAVAAIQSLSLAGSPEVKAGKTATLPAGKEPPAVRVACTRGGRCEVYDAARVIVTYVLVVAMYDATGGQTGDDETLEEWREAINRKLDDRASFSAVTGINEVNRQEGPPFVAQALDALHNASTLTFAVEVIEPRNN